MKRQVVSSQNHTFEFLDGKGRTMGSSVTIIEHTLVEADAEEWGRNPGTYYHVRVRASRNSRDFGPSTNGKFWMRSRAPGL